MDEFNDIISQFLSLHNENGQQGNFNVVPILGLSHKLGRSSEGFPMFFLRTNNSATTVPNLQREILSVEYNVPCALVDNNGNTQDDLFSIITLRSSEEVLQRYFIEIFAMMLRKIPAVPSRRELSIEVENLITIFSALTLPPKKEIQGLWAELLVIEQSTHPETLINAWHNSPDAKYDFTLGRDKIEVKSTSSEERIHRFSLDQLNPSPNSKLLIASTIVRESGKDINGLSVRDLYDKICQKVSSYSSRLHLYEVMAKTIGSNVNSLENSYFDYITAKDTLAYFDASRVPHIDKSSVPELVTNVKFDSNVSHLSDVRTPSSGYDCSDSLLFKCLI